MTEVKLQEKGDISRIKSNWIYPACLSPGCPDWTQHSGLDSAAVCPHLEEESTTQLDDRCKVEVEHLQEENVIDPKHIFSVADIKEL